MATYTVDKIEYNSNVYVLQDSGALQLTGGSVTGPVTFGDTITVDDATLGTMVVNGHASFTNGISGDLVGNVTGNVTGTATNASKVNNLTVQTAVPANAVFTDSTVSTLTLASGSTAGTALSHGGKYTLTAGTKTVSFTMPSAPSVPTSAASKVTGITASTTATKTTLGTAFTIPNVTSAGSASTWAFEDVACDDITSWSAGSGSASISGDVDSSDSTQLIITISHTHTAPSLGYTAKTVSHVKSGGNGSAPTLGTAFTVPNVTGNTSATVSITDPGHTHTLS